MIDYKDFAKRTIDAIVALIADDALTDKHYHALEALRQEYVMAHIQPEYPLPDWAERYNDNRELVEGTQLCTKDGRQRGNARIISIDHNNPIMPKGSVVYKVRTDIGTEMNLLADEINSMFYIGRYILKEGQ